MTPILPGHSSGQWSKKSLSCRPPVPDVRPVDSMRLDLEGARPVNFNFFEWIRTSVRQSVLLGVSDAVGQMGMPHETQEAQQHLLEVFRENGASGTPRAIGTAAPRKKLGRSLKQIQAVSEKAA